MECADMICTPASTLERPCTTAVGTREPGHVTSAVGCTRKSEPEVQAKVTAKANKSIRNGQAFGSAHSSSGPGQSGSISQLPGLTLIEVASGVQVQFGNYFLMYNRSVEVPGPEIEIDPLPALSLAFKFESLSYASAAPLACLVTRVCPHRACRLSLAPSCSQVLQPVLQALPVTILPFAIMMRPHAYCNDCLSLPLLSESPPSLRVEHCTLLASQRPLDTTCDSDPNFHLQDFASKSRMTALIPTASDVAENSTMIALKHEPVAKYVVRQLGAHFPSTFFGFFSHVVLLHSITSRSPKDCHWRRGAERRPTVPAPRPQILVPRRQLERRPPSGQTPPVLSPRPEPDSSEFTRVARFSPTQKPIPPHKPPAKLSGNIASNSLASSLAYENSNLSSDFTLSSSTTDGSSSPPSSLFKHKPREESKANAFSAHIRQLYRDILALETKTLTDSGELQDESRLVIKGGPSVGAEDTEKARWKKATDDHKKYAVSFL
jgi:hypothetical protein